MHLNGSSLTKDIVVLNWKTPASSDNNARRIAESLGAEVTVLSWAAARDVESIKQRVPPCIALIVHIETLVQIAGEFETVQGLLELTDLAAHVFIYGFGPTDRHASILQVLSLGSLTAVERLPAADMTFRVADTYREWCGSFTGLSVGAADPRRDACFVDGTPRPGKAVLVRVAGRPFFARVDHGGSDVFFLACSELADLDEEIPWKVGLVPWFSRLMPLMVFLRKALGNRIWHSDCAQACIIIDDPLLKKRYGFLEYRRLLHAMGELGFSICIAFIPWNYRRSRKEIADLFLTAPPSLSLCIHGCDHIGAEFAAKAFELLCGKARLALVRMRLHSQLSGIPFDDVMVFPQGLFSSQALKALGTCGYLAAVNTDLCPSDMPQVLTLRRLLDIAVTWFGDFPLFGRHYPGDPAEFAFDLFLGKPALVVEHHGYFREGYEALRSFAKQLNDLDERLEWSNLGTICSRACLKRVTPQGDVHVRFYASRFWLENNGTRTQTFLLSRRRTPEGSLPEVTVNGRQWAREQRGDSLIFNVSLEPGQQADIRILSHDAAAFVSWQPTLTLRAKVFTRRVLCEFRDNYVQTNRPLAALMSTVYKSESATKTNRSQ